MPLYIILYIHILSCKCARNCKEILINGRSSALRSEHTYTPALILWINSRAQQLKILHVQVSYDGAKALYGEQTYVDHYCIRESLEMYCHKY